MTGQPALCRDCIDFESDPMALEQRFGQLAALSSAHAATRLGDGVCRRFDRIVPDHARCGVFRPSRAGRVQEG